MRWVVLLALSFSLCVVKADELPFDTNAIKSLTIEQAEALVRRRSRGFFFNSLELNGLSNITPEVVSVLRKLVTDQPFYTGGMVGISSEPNVIHVSLDGLHTITAALAKELAPIPHLSLNGVHNIDEATANGFCSQPPIGAHRRIDLNGLKGLSASSAAKIAMAYDYIGLDGLEELSIPLAKALKSSLSLNLANLKEMPTDVAVVLAKGSADLDLPGITSISRGVAQAFVSHLGNLHLDGVQKLDPDVAAILQKRENGNSLSMLGLTDLPSPAFTQFYIRVSEPWYPNEHIELPNLNTLRPEDAKVLAATSGYLQVGVRTLPIEIAKILVTHKCWGKGDPVYSEVHELELNRLDDELTADAAKILATYEGELRLPGLTTLREDVADALKNHSGRLALGCVKIDEGAAAILAQHKGPLELNSLTDLTSVPLAKKVEDLGSVERINDAVAEALAKQNTKRLSGVNPQSLSRRQLKLVAHLIPRIDIDQLPLETLKHIADSAELSLSAKKITPSVAEVLAAGKADLNLDCDGLAHDAAKKLITHSGALRITSSLPISDKTIELLLKGKPGIELSQWCPTKLSSVLLAKHYADKNEDLYLDEIYAVSLDAARELAKHAQGSLQLNGIERLDDATAAVLAHHKGEIYLEGLRDLKSVELASKLASQDFVNLPNLRTLTIEVASKICECEGQIELGIQEVDDQTAGILAGSTGELSLPQLKSLTSVPLAEKLANSLPSSPGGIGNKNFSGIRELNPEIARVLRKRESSLSLDGLTQISPELAKELAGHVGALSLRNLRTLSQESAEWLRRHSGFIQLPSLTQIDEETANILRQNEDIFFPLR